MPVAMWLPEVYVVYRTLNELDDYPSSIERDSCAKSVQVAVIGLAVRDRKCAKGEEPDEDLNRVSLTMTAARPDSA